MLGGAPSARRDIFLESSGSWVVRLFVDHCKKLGLMSPFSIDQSPGGGKDSNGP